MSLVPSLIPTTSLLYPNTVFLRKTDDRAVPACPFWRQNNANRLFKRLGETVCELTLLSIEFYRRKFYRSTLKALAPSCVRYRYYLRWLVVIEVKPIMELPGRCPANTGTSQSQLLCKVTWFGYHQWELVRVIRWRCPGTVFARYLHT